MEPTNPNANTFENYICPNDTLVGHSCWSLCRKLFWDTVGHSSGTLLWVTLTGHSCRTLLWDTLTGHSCRKTPVGHSYETHLWWDTLVGHSSIHSCGTLLSLTSRMPRLHRHLSRHASRSPVARRQSNALPTKAAQIRMALRHHERNFATRSKHITRYHQSSRSPAIRRAYTSTPVARRHANALPAKAAQIRMALRHHERNFATRSATH